jgi:hypothetical protein
MENNEEFDLTFEENIVNFYRTSDYLTILTENNKLIFYSLEKNMIIGI